MSSPFIVGLTLYREPRSYLKMPYACYREIRWAVNLILSRFSNTNGVSGRIRSVDHRSESGGRRLKTNIKEIRDPIHNFIHVDRDEVELIDSRPFQRLRHIHQLALTHLVYPAATHKRFEHSLGVMELAGRAFDAITDRENVDEQARALFPKITQSDFLGYWRKVLRLLETLRIVVPPPVTKPSLIQTELPIGTEKSEEKSTEPALGLLIGGIHSAEALLLARYFMFAQVYYHPVRMAYDYHLMDFLKAWLPSGTLPTDYEKHLVLTDNEVNTAIREAASDASKPGHKAAERILQRMHFKLLRQFTPDELTHDPLLPSRITNELKNKFGANRIHAYDRAEKKSPKRFAVRMKDGRTESSIAVSQVLRSYPTLNFSLILIDPDLKQLALEFLKKS